MYRSKNVWTPFALALTSATAVSTLTLILTRSNKLPLATSSICWSIQRSSQQPELRQFCITLWSILPHTNAGETSVEERIIAERRGRRRHCEAVEREVAVSKRSGCRMRRLCFEEMVILRGDDEDDRARVVNSPRTLTTSPSKEVSVVHRFTLHQHVPTRASVETQSSCR